jgi:hypothetical protein
MSQYALAFTVLLILLIFITVYTYGVNRYIFPRREEPIDEEQRQNVALRNLRLHREREIGGAQGAAIFQYPRVQPPPRAMVRPERQSAAGGSVSEVPGQVEVQRLHTPKSAPPSYTESRNDN